MTPSNQVMFDRVMQSESLLRELYITHQMNLREVARSMSTTKYVIGRAVSVLGIARGMSEARSVAISKNSELCRIGFCGFDDKTRSKNLEEFNKSGNRKIWGKPSVVESKIHDEMVSRGFVLDKFFYVNHRIRYCVDYFHESTMIGIEFDGPEHNPEYDRARDLVLKNKFGITIYRFSNSTIDNKAHLLMTIEGLLNGY